MYTSLDLALRSGKRNGFEELRTGFRIKKEMDGFTD
jgi:hypothetical protein